MPLLAASNLVGFVALYAAIVVSRSATTNEMNDFEDIMRLERYRCVLGPGNDISIAFDGNGTFGHAEVI